MANRFAVASGNFNDTATWSTTATGSPGASVPVAGDNAIANNRTVTITANATCDIVTNNTTYGGTVGGSFILSNGVELNAAITSDGPSNVSTDTVVLSGSNSATISASSITSDIGLSQQYATVRHSSSGTLNITAASITGGNCTTSQPLDCIIFSGSGTLNVTANITGGGGSNSGAGIRNSGNGNLFISGNLIGGISSVGYAVINSSTGLCQINGNISASSAAIGLFNSSTGAVTITGNCTATNGFHAVSSTNASSTVKASGKFDYSLNGTVPVYTPKFILNTTPAAARTRYALNGLGAFVDMFTADNNLGQANPTDVRSGVSYASGTLTGSLTVPARGSVALSVNYGPSMPFTATRSGTTATATLAYSYPLVVGDQITVTGAFNTEWNNTYTIASVVSGTSVTFTVPATHSATAGTGALMQTTGTAVLDPAAVASAVWGAATRTITGGLVDTATTLTNAPTVPTAAAIATQVRTELSSELAKVSALNTTRLGQCTTTEILGNLLAQANS